MCEVMSTANATLNSSHHEREIEGNIEKSFVNLQMGEVILLNANKWISPVIKEDLWICTLAQEHEKNNLKILESY